MKITMQMANYEREIERESERERERERENPVYSTGIYSLIDTKIQIS